MQGIKAAKEYATIKGTDKRNIAIDSRINTLKTKDELVLAYDDSTAITFPHGLEYVPGYLSFYKNSFANYWIFSGGGADYINNTNFISPIDTMSFYSKGKVFVLFDPLDVPTKGIKPPKKFGLSVSQDKTDIKNALSTNILFDSNLEHFMIVKEMEVSCTYSDITPGDGGYELNYSFEGTKVAHGLDYTPAFIASFLCQDYEYYILNPYYVEVPTEAGKSIFVCVDSTYVWIKVNIYFGNSFVSPESIYTDGDTITAKVRLLNKELE